MLDRLAVDPETYFLSAEGHDRWRGAGAVRRVPDAALRLDPAVPPCRRVTMPDGIDVGIVAYRSRDLLRDCLDSLADAAPARPVRIIVVDNDSRDGTVELVRARRGVELIEAGKNLGFAAATNLALEANAARGTSSPSTPTPACRQAHSTPWST